MIQSLHIYLPTLLTTSLHLRSLVRVGEDITNIRITTTIVSGTDEINQRNSKRFSAGVKYDMLVLFAYIGWEHDNSEIFYFIVLILFLHIIGQRTQVIISNIIYSIQGGRGILTPFQFFH